MTDAPARPEERLLILAPVGRDADLACNLLTRAGIACERSADLNALVAELEIGAAAAMIAEEALGNGAARPLLDWLARQPPWSDLPVLVLARPGADSDAVAAAMNGLGNVTVLERPTRVAALVSAARSALRARQRQYQLREGMAEAVRGHQTRALLASIVESSDDAIVSVTLDGTITSWNRGAERLYGYTAAEAVGAPVAVLIPAGLQAEAAALLERLRNGGRIEQLETERLTRDGRLLHVALTVSPMLDVDGRVAGASKVARDITERKRADRALREADRRKDEFLAILAHELRNPLAPIRNSLHVLRLTSRDDAATRQAAEMMMRQVDHMVRLVDDLLDAARITRGRIELQRETLDVAGVVRNAVEIARPLIDAARHRLTVELPAERLTLEGDPVRLAQVFANLLNNAAKYTDPGGEIDLVVRREGEQAVISVRDTGIGIAAERLADVFQPFTQVARSARGQGGLGIGLTLVRELVSLHGGTVTAKSAGLGQGSEFVVHLPLVDGVRPAARPRHVADVSGQLASHRVLVVDDNRDAADSLGELLALLGAEARVVYSGAEALRQFEAYAPSVVLLDLGMPELDGFEVARRMRDLPQNGATTLVALTGWGQAEDRRRSAEAGFDFHLIKPADAESLRSVLRAVEGGAPRPSAAAEPG